MHQYLRQLLFIALLFACFYADGKQKAATVPLFYEKVYLHTDRDTYAPGEDVWFKAYLVNAQNYQPIDYSHNLYVELISPASKIIFRLVVRLECGLGNGDFKLIGKLSSGNYRLRAYTNWMRNFGDNFVFEKKIAIVALPVEPTAAMAQPASVQHSVKNVTLNGIADTLLNSARVMFFPEGGSLVNNVRSAVAVKAEDELGRSLALTGTIVATSGRVVANFICDSTGMGLFNLTPDETQLYHADAIVKGVKQSFKLPKALHKGFVLSTSTNPETIAAEISCSGFALSEYAGSYLTIEARHANKIYYKQRVPVVSSSMLVQIPTGIFAEGVACVTLYDEHARPLAERVVYVHHPENSKLTLTTDKAVYGPKEKVTVKINVSDTTKTNLSLAAVDAGIVPVETENMMEYLTLRSEIKGTIEHPERYFETTNTDRFKQLDLLLMTQGWRDFIWKKLAEQPPKITYDVEQWLPITGRVRKMFSDSPLPNMNITMFATNAVKEKLFLAKTDSAGRFNIDGAILMGNSYGLFTSRTVVGKRMGWIKIDSLGRNWLPVKPVNGITGRDTIIATTKTNLIAREERKKKISFTNNNELNEVTIRSSKDAIPDKVFTVTEKNYGKDDEYFNYLLSYLVKCVPKSSISTDPFTGLPALAIVKGSFPGVGLIQDIIPIKCSYLNDPKLFSTWDLQYVIMNDVVSVTVCYPDGKNRPPVVKVLLRLGALDKIREYNTTWADLKGYDEARTFYAPKYDAADNKTDLRTTIHWEPNITTDKNGEATVSFYNAEPKNTIRLLVQGVNGKGQLLVASAVYMVK